MLKIPKNADLKTVRHSREWSPILID